MSIEMYKRHTAHVGIMYYGTAEKDGDRHSLIKETVRFKRPPIIILIPRTTLNEFHLLLGSAP